MAPDFRESFERKSRGFADPCAQDDFVTKRRRSFVVDLVPQDDPADRLLCFRAGDRLPMRSGNTLNPPQVDSMFTWFCSSISPVDTDTVISKCAQVMP